MTSKKLQKKIRGLRPSEQLRIIEENATNQVWKETKWTIFWGVITGILIGLLIVLYYEFN